MGTFIYCDKLFCVLTVGGINTVLRTKAAISVEEMGDQYCMIGPYIEKSVQMEVEVEDPVKNEMMLKVIKKMREYGFRVSTWCNLLWTITECTVVHYCCKNDPSLYRDIEKSGVPGSATEESDRHPEWHQRLRWPR